MTKKVFEYSEKVNGAITTWRDKHEKSTHSLDEKNFEITFASIYAFRSVIDIIDKEIAEDSIEKDYKVTTTPEGDITLKVQPGSSSKYKPLIDTWKKLDDIRFPASATKDLEMKFIDVIKLRYANYMGFIHGIIDYNYIVYETE